MTNSFLAYHTEPMWASLIFVLIQKGKEEHTGVSITSVLFAPVIDSCESCSHRRHPEVRIPEISLNPNSVCQSQTLIPRGI